MERENYINIQGWMVSELGLKGNELLVYAIIYGFSQDGKSVFAGSSKYLAEWLSTSQNTIFTILKKLVEKKYLIKIEKVINNIKLYDYKINLDPTKKFGSLPKNLVGGVQKFGSILNIDNIQTSKEMEYSNIEKKEIYKEKKDKFYEFWALYPKQRAGSKQKAQIAYLKVLKEKRATEEHLLAKVKEYANSREVREGFAKGCAAWLNDDRFNSDYNGGTNNGIGKDYNRENTGEYSGLGRKIGF